MNDLMMFHEFEDVFVMSRICFNYDLGCVRDTVGDGSGYFRDVLGKCDVCFRWTVSVVR